jgi:CheY-like chemotaxis protein
MARILVIDDQTHVRGAIVVALRAQGHDVVDAKNGASALRKFAHADFDLAIVDAFMSAVHLAGTGGSALDHLHKAPNLPGVVCLNKPFRPPELSQPIEKAIAVAAFAGAADPAPA